MIAEAAPIDREDKANSNAVEKDLSDSNPITSNTISPTSPDTFTTPSLSPTSFTSAPEIIPPEEANAIIKRLEDSPASGDDVTIAADTKEGSQSLGGAGPGIPLRSSSNSQAQTLTSAPAPEKISDELKSSSRRASKDIIREKSRSGSLASRHSKQEKLTGPSLTTQEKAKASLPAASSSIAKPKKGKFLSFLNCCGSSDNANLEATEPAVPPRKANVLQSNRDRQAAPLGKSNTSGGAVSGSGSKETPVDTIGGTPYTEHKAAEKPKMITQRSKEMTAIENTAVKKTANASENGIAQQRSNEAQNLPSAGSSGPVAEIPKEDTLPAQGTASVLPPNPPQAIPIEESVAVQGEAINDRTAQQEQDDSDIPMTEAPPIAPEVEESTRSAEPQQNESSNQITLPPPPPRDTQARPTPQRERSPGAERQQWLLPPLQPRFKGKKCLVLDLDETLVHSSFKILHQADFTIPVEIEGQYHNVYVIKRPGVDQFMKRVGELYEVVVFTASVSKYGDPLLDQLDIHKVVHHRLFRESCYNHAGNYVKDLSQVGRDLRETIIIDNSPTSYIFHPQHAVPISSWFSDAHDNELLDLIPVLEDLAGSQVRDVSLVLDVAL
ncbi:MAG: hypothetical protein Q9195_007420 [Heterodermia aff. obscurata]